MSSMSYLDLADIYDAAADYLETHDWLRGQFCHEKTGAVCLGGALSKVTVNNNTAYTAAVEDIADALPLVEVGKGVMVKSITVWNDRVAQDKFEVMDVLRGRAKTLRNEAS